MISQIGNIVKGEVQKTGDVVFVNFPCFFMNHLLLRLSMWLFFEKWQVFWDIVSKHLPDFFSYGDLRKIELAVLRYSDTNKIAIGERLPSGVARFFTMRMFSINFWIRNPMCQKFLSR
jgi:hypothetical protein